MQYPSVRSRSIDEYIVFSHFVVNPFSSRMDPSSDTIDLKPSPTAILSSGVLSGQACNMTGFASLVNLKDKCAVTRGRRIQISQLGVGTTAASTNIQIKTEDMGPTIKKRWSFHSSNQINDILKEDRVMKPISSPKRRKSSGSALTRSTSDNFAFAEEINSCDVSQQIINSKEQSQSSKNLLTARQPQSHSKLRHHRRSKLIKLGECEASRTKSKQRYLDEYFMQADAYPISYHQFRMRQSKHSKETAAPDYLSLMPDEVLLRIFKHLPKTSLGNLGRANHRLLGLIQDDTLWKRLCLMGKLLSPDHLLIVMSRKPMYLRMSRAHVPDPIDIPADLTDLAASSQLLYLDLSSAIITSSTLALIMRLSPKLVKLSLEHLEVTKDVIDAMLSFVTTIEVLNLTMCYDLDAKALITFLTSCGRLKELNLGCMKVDWNPEELTAVINALPGTLQQLNISGFRNLLDNSHVQIVANRCPKLIELDISDSQEVQAESIEHILRLTNLQHLGLSRCYGIEPPVYPLLASHKKLKYLDLFSLFKENSIRQLSSNLPGIEINKFPFSAIARPTVGNKRSSIWLQRVRD